MHKETTGSSSCAVFICNLVLALILCWEKIYLASLSWIITHKEHAESLNVNRLKCDSFYYKLKRNCLIGLDYYGLAVA